jgi:RNA polymerase sigma factor (sigma-70 family)
MAREPAPALRCTPVVGRSSLSAGGKGERVSEAQDDTSRGRRTSARSARLVSLRTRLAGGPGEPDSQLIESARAGDLDAYEELVRRYQGLGYRMAATIVGAADAEDVAQEAFVKAFGKLHNFRHGAAFRPWLLTIVANEARNRRRSARRHLAALRRVAGQRVEDVPAADERLAADERRAALLAAVRSLPLGERRVVQCRYLLELTEAETATVLSLPAGTVKSRLSRALSRLRQAMPEQPPEATEGSS